MDPTKSAQNGSNQAAPPPQDQTDQSPKPRADDTEQAEQRIEQEVSIAIVTPGNSTIAVSAQWRAEWDEAARLAQYQPLPDPNEDDFADEPLPKPYDPETSTYDWAKPEAWIEEKDSEGRTLWRNRFGSFVRYSRPDCLPHQDENQHHRTT